MCNVLSSRSSIRRSGLISIAEWAVRSPGMPWLVTNFHAYFAQVSRFNKLWRGRCRPGRNLGRHIERIGLGFWRFSSR
jgi:hypothetical protein